MKTTRRDSGMTLVEVIVSMTVLMLAVGGVLASLLQNRRLTEGSVTQASALTIVQGYIEQLKNMPLQQFVNAAPTDTQNNPQLTTSFTLPTLKDLSSTVIQLRTTPSTIPIATLLNAVPGTTPTGVYDNLQTFDMNSQGTPATTTWGVIWPGANTSLTPYPTTNPGLTDLRMNFWVHLSDLSPTAPAKSKAYGILIVYTWQYVDGGRIRFARGAVRSIRSAVQTF